MAKTATDLITNVRRRAQLSQDNGQAISDTDILAFASDELQNVIGPKIYAMRGWHYACRTPFTLTSSRNYRIPDRAAGGTIISVEIVNSPIPNRPVNYVHPLQASQANGQPASESYYIWGNTIVLSPGAPTSGTMVVRYLLAPSALYTKFATGISIDGDNQIDYDSTSLNVPTDGSTGYVDFIRANSPYEVIMAQVPVTSNGAQLTFAAGVLSIGNSGQATYGTVDGFSEDLNTKTILPNKTVYIVDAGFSPFPQLNDEFHDLLAQRTAMRCMESIGHSEDLKNMSQKLSDLEQAFLRAISPRERGDMKVILTEDFFFDRRF